MAAPKYLKSFGPFINVRVDNRQSDLDLDESWAEKACLTISREISSHIKSSCSSSELSVSFVDLGEMSELNERYLGKPGPTDVLSFYLGEDSAREEPDLLGEVVVCPRYVQDQKRDGEFEPQREMVDLLAHGILHLLGYDHDTPQSQEEMFGLQRRLLEAAIRQSP